MAGAERVRRPDGKLWVHDQRSSSRGVHVEPTAAGPVLLVLCTHDRAKAADMVSVRWGAYFPGVPIPEGELEWRRRAIETWVGQTSVRQKRIEASTGTETLAFPVVAFRDPRTATR